MKKITVVMLCFFLVAVIASPVTASASESLSGIKIVGEAWAWGEKVPDYVGGFWLNDDGILTVGLVENGRREEVLAMVGEVPVEFVDQTYAYNDLKHVMNELSGCFELDVGLMTVGVDMKRNAVEVGVDTTKEAAAAFVEVTAVLYGGKVYLRDLYGEAIVPGEIPDGRTDKSFPWGVVLGVICAIAVAVVIGWKICSQAMGKGKNLSRRDVECLIRRSVELSLVRLSDFSE